MKNGGRELAFCSSKHFWHSLNKRIVSWQVVFKNESSFFSETSSWNPITFQDWSRHFLANVPGYPFYMQLIVFDPFHKKNAKTYHRQFLVGIKTFSLQAAYFFSAALLTSELRQPVANQTRTLKKNNTEEEIERAERRTVAVSLR